MKILRTAILAFGLLGLVGMGACGGGKKAATTPTGDPCGAGEKAADPCGGGDPCNAGDPCGGDPCNAGDPCGGDPCGNPCGE